METLTPLNLTVPQAATMLAVSRAHVYNLMTAGDLPFVQLGGERSYRRIRLVDLVAYNDARVVRRR